MTDTRKKQAEIDQHLKTIQEDLEDASTLMIQTESGEIKEATPWTGADYLNSNPLLRAKADEYMGENSELMDYNLEQALLEEEEEELASSNLLERAKELWMMAVKERNAGNYEKSRELLVQAEAYLKSYRANAVGKTYTVVKRDVKTDCLWRIAGYKDIYNDPFLWPKIWQRNQKIIPNPDLIYPGQVLIIPPLK